MTLAIILVALLITSPSFANPVKVLVVELDNKQILSEKHVRCISVAVAKDSVEFRLTPEGKQIFETTTENNVGKNMSISVCSTGKISPKIAQKIQGDSFNFGLTPAQYKCLMEAQLKKCRI